MHKDSPPKGVKRREFLKVLGVSGAAVGAAACSEPTGKLIPYLVSPDETVPGVSTYYATTCRECAAACGLIAETRDGRTIKLEGNPEHPVNRGALCARGQAALQGLYNPDRFRAPMIKENGAWRVISWNDALARLGQWLGEARTSGKLANAIFLNQHETGSFPGFLDQWLAGYGMRPHLSVDFEADQAAMAAHRAAYGTAMPRFDFASAKLIVSFSADFLDTWGASVPQQLDFADARAKLENAPRFVYIGPRRSLTGLNADQWIPCRPGSELAIANFLRGQESADQAAQASGAPAAALQALARELAAAKPALVLCGVRGDNAAEVSAAVAALNQQSGGATRGGEGYAGFDGIASDAEVLDAVERMRGGQVPIVFVRGVNPAYFLPKGANFADAFAKVGHRVSFSLFPDETTELCDLVLPDLHSLESWGDAEATRGTIGLQQPTMDPVFANTRATADVLIGMAKSDPAMAARYPQADYRGWLISRFPGGAAALAAALPKGLASGSVATRTVAAAAPSTTRRAQPIGNTQGNFFFVTYPSPTLGDGRGSNKPWLQELPDPVSKITWSSWIEIHPETAAAQGIDRGDVLEISANGRTIRAPAYLYLGIDKDTVAMPLGQGHRATGQIADFDPKHHDVNNPAEVQWGYGRYSRNLGAHAFDVIPVGTNGAGGLAWTATKVTVRKTGDHVVLPSTEGSARQHGRGIAQALTATDLGGGRVGLIEARGAEQANQISTGGGPEQGARGGELRGNAATNQSAQATNEPRAHEEELPGDASHAFLPGLRSPVAADAQGILGSPSSKDQGKNKGMYAPDDPRNMTKRRWAMTIDLARCTGCSACVTACYAENNIATVGAPWQSPSVWSSSTAGFNITRGREMNWIRLERYFEGNPAGKAGEDFETRFVPMLCQHCGNAPCEPVCPVYATYHAPDGLNVQVYNRCVGTRYCSNNCPYKVRYFNWLPFGESDRKQYAFPEPLNWQLNPDVTVRTKGVMEKCSFCIQRIREAENRATLEKRDILPDEFTTSCAAACPSRAITFGDAADPNWTVARLAEDRRAYHVFEELNTYTAVVYLKKVNHPTPAAASTGAPATR